MFDLKTHFKPKFSDWGGGTPSFLFKFFMESHDSFIVIFKHNQIYRELYDIVVAFVKQLVNGLHSDSHCT